jgi:glycosyltransferase involved in cell wall biosynthesis
MLQPLVSIIIPTYNRAHLIGETLDSVLAQTYTNWECIVVDDGSTDNTAEVVQIYLDKDPRFQYHHRPANRLKGANACRNYGFEVSKGEYVNWFDDDDLMIDIKIEVQLNVLLNKKLDFNIAKFSNFKNKGSLIKELSYMKNTNKNPGYKEYLRHQLFWGTIDFLGKREIFEQIRFNEFLKSGQEYHFFVLVLLNKPAGEFLDDVLSKRRIHDESIQHNINRNFKKKYLNKVDMYWATYQEGKHKYDKFDKLFLLKECYLFIQYLMKLKIVHPKKVEVYEESKITLGFLNVIKLEVLLWITYITGKGDVKIRRLIKNQFNT